MSKLQISTEDRMTSGPAETPYVLARISGFIDAPNYLAFETGMEKVTGGSSPWVVLDFAGVEYINSTGISAVIRFQSVLQERGGSLALVQVSRNVGLTMHLLGVTTLVPFLKTLPESEDYIEGKGVPSQDVGPDPSVSVASDAESSESAPVFVDSAGGTSRGTVIVAVPKEGPFTRILQSRIEHLDGDYHLVHSVEGINETLARWNPDLIVLDHRLKGADSFVEMLKVETSHSLTSVIMLYESGTDVHRRRDFRVWENDYLVDPFDLMNLFTLAESELRRVPKDRRLFTQQVKYQFTSERAAVTKGLKLTEQLIHKLRFDDAETTAVFAALKEAIDNSVLHGNRHDPNKTVTVNFVVDPNKVTFIVEDEGEGFDHQYFLSQLDTHEAFERAKNRIREGGRGGLGILLMHKCSDRLEYSGDGSLVRLERNLRQ